MSAPEGARVRTECPLAMVVQSGRRAAWSACIILCVLPRLYAADIKDSRRSADLRLEVTRVPSGAELVTLFSKQQPRESAETAGLEIPILSVLRDTLDDSDPENDRLRQVWIYSYTKPSVWQRIVAGLPFLYRQASPGTQKPVGLPRPLLDLAAPGRNTMRSLLGELLQTGLLDDIGASVRLASRGYRGNASDNRDLHIYQALLAFSDLEKSSTPEGFLTPEDMGVLGARLTLATRPLGGIVSEKYLLRAKDREIAKSNQNRGRNWELLRQKAEESGLYFEPMTLGTREENFALLWIEQGSVASPPPKAFDGKFLGISNPFTDPKLRDWAGYSQTWYIDPTGSRVASGSAPGRAARMIPLALYALDHPRVPLLLVDLRQPWKLGAEERARRIATDITTNLLRWTPFGKWQFTVAKSALFFVRRRHGAALDRSARLRAYAQLQYSLKLGTSIDPELHRELTRQSQRLGINPFGNRPDAQVGVAHQQYAALIAFARSPDGLAARLDHDRAAELSTGAHSVARRTLFKAATAATFGLYRHREQLDLSGYLRLDEHRRFSYHKRLLERVVQSGTRPDVAWRIDEVRRSVDTVLELGERNDRLRPAAGAFVSGLFKKTGDETLRRQCAAGLIKLQDFARPGKLVVSAGPAAGARSVSTGASESMPFK
jgi:hypothetical protein